jgi:hypothetical protein
LFTFFFQRPCITPTKIKCSFIYFSVLSRLHKPLGIKKTGKNAGSKIRCFFYSVLSVVVVVRVVRLVVPSEPPPLKIRNNISSTMPAAKIHTQGALNHASDVSMTLSVRVLVAVLFSVFIVSCANAYTFVNSRKTNADIL